MSDNQNRISERIAVTGLLVAALLWGFSYPLTKYVENCPTFFIISLRFAIAAIALALVFHKKFKELNRETVRYSLILSIAVFLMFAFGIWGIKYTTSVRSSFFTCLSFLIVPLINKILFKVKVSKIIFISAFICLIGIFLLCYAPGMGTLILNPGDALCILAATAGSLHIILVSRLSEKKHIDPSLFTVFLMGFVAIWGSLAALFTGQICYTAIDSSEIIAIALMGLLCSAASFCLQSHMEVIVPPNRVGVIFALEPASGCILSVALLHESMTWTGWLGALIIIVSIIYMEIASSRQNSLQ